MGESRPVGDLLPGIVGDIVFKFIVPKLQWKDFYILASVSCAWYNAIRSRQVFESRVLYHSSESLVPLYYSTGNIALYSMRENSWHKLPPIIDPFGGRQIAMWGQCISMDGKIYALEGVIDCDSYRNKMFMFDLAAGRGQWVQCASMKECRRDFGSAVMDGKIYVFGGRIPSRFLLLGILDPIVHLSSSAEVYDPKKDTWSPIRQMTTGRVGHHVTPIGEELFIYGGRIKSIDDPRLCTSGYSLEAYHPLKNEWRVVQRSWNQPNPGIFFAVQGNLFSIETVDLILGLDLLALRKYDVRGNAGRQMHSISFDSLLPVEDYLQWQSKIPVDILVVDDELVAVVYCSKWESETLGKRREGLYLLQSTGLGSENQKISWKLRAITSDKIHDPSNYWIQKL